MIPREIPLRLPNPALARRTDVDQDRRHHTLIDGERKPPFSPYDASSHTTSRKYCPLLEPGQYVRVQISLGQGTIQHVRIEPDTRPI